MLVFQFGVFLEKTLKLSIFFVLGRNRRIILKNKIIDIFEGVSLQFLHFVNFCLKNRNSHVLVFNFGVFFRKNMKIKYFLRSWQKSWNYFQKDDN